MRYVLRLTSHAIKDLASFDISIQRIIAKKLDFYLSTVDPVKYAEPLKAPFQGKYRFRIGEYRIIFIVEPSGSIIILLILSIRHRKDAYK